MSESENASLIRSLPWKERIPILTLLAVITLLAWVYLVDMAAGMNDMMSSALVP